MTRKECLDKAAECVLNDRQNNYGKPEDCFGMIARMWGAYLGVCVSPHDVAAMMALLKIARFRHNPFHEDNAVDCAGYAACMIETATAWEREQAEEQGPQDGDEVVVLWKHKPKAESGCCQNGKDQPEFKRGDSLLVTMPDGEDIRCIYVGESTQPGCCCVRYLGGDFSGDTDDTVPIDQLRRVPVSKAEGCEEPEFEHGDAEGWVQLTFKAGDAVEWFSFGRKDAAADGWHPAFYLCRAGDRDYHVVQDIDGMYHVVNYANIRSPEAMYRPGDRVEALSFDGARWEDAVVERVEVASGQWRCTVRLASGERHCLPVAGSIRRPSKARAEGCEALVEKDAPQTKEELFNRIVDCNPATFGRPRTPTGEELAEMAEEDEKHG